MGDFADLVASESRGLVAATTATVGADLSVEDIAETLRATVPAVRSLLYRGRVALRSEPIVQSYAERAGPS